MSKERYTYEETKNGMGEVRDFFDKIDVSQLEGQDKIKLDVIKDMWADYYHNFVQYDCCIEDRIKSSVTLFVMARCISEETVRAKITDFTYSYMAGLNDELFSISEYENLNEMLKSVGLMEIPNYFKAKEEIKKVYVPNTDSYSIAEYQKMCQMILESESPIKRSISAGKPIKFVLTAVDSTGTQMKFETDSTNENKD